MIIKEEVRDLFTVPQGFYLVHCISGDFALGAGIAKQFVKVYNMKEKLESRWDFIDKDENKAIIIDNVFNLITKRKYFQKPTYDSLREALEDMKEQANNLLITKLAMPKIGCGLDRLEWSRVKEILEEIFEDTDIEILVCIL